MTSDTFAQVSDLAKRLTRKETDVGVLKPDKMAEYPPLTRLLEDSLRGASKRGTLLIPELRADGNETVGVFSDYGGESADSHFLTYSVLVFGWNHAYVLQEEFKKVRSDNGFSDTTEMSYKNLRRGNLKRALRNYLSTSDWIAGMLFTLVVDKRVRSTFVKSGRSANEGFVSLLESGGFGKRKPKVAEKLLRVVHTSAYLTGWLSGQGQKIFWMTDNDEIVPDEQKTRQTLELFRCVLPMYSQHSYGKIGYTKPSEMDDTGQLKDFLSVTDLAAGAVEGYLTRQKKGEVAQLKPEAETILNWLGHHGVGLKKHTMLVEPDDDDGLVCSELRFTPEVPHDKAVTIPIAVEKR